jgi:hypothetical protein
MMIQYVGVFCALPECGKFNVITQHEVEIAEKIGTDFSFSLDDDWPCKFCGDTRRHANDVIAYSISPDGSNPRYPHRNAA